MKLSAQAEKGLTTALGVVCLVLLWNLVFRSGGVRATASRTPDRPEGRGPKGQRPADSAKDQPALADFESRLRLDVWKALQSRPLPELGRNPFEMERPIVAPGKGSTSGPPQSPPPPPIPLKPLGHSQTAKGVEEAFVTDDEQVYVVHVGEVFAGKYKVLRITSTFVEVEDETSRQRIQLPFPQ